MSKIKILAFLFIFTLTFLPSTFASSDMITGQGVLNIAWQTPLDELQEKNMTFTELDFDRKKKLFIYTKENDNTFKYGNVDFYSTRYFFWDDRFAAIKGFFDSEKKSDSFQQLYNTLIGQFGLPQKQNENALTSEQNLYWQTEKTGIKVTYYPELKAGEFYIYSSDLNLEYVDFIRNMPGEIPTYPNEPTGFEDLAWGTKREEIVLNGQKLVPNKAENILGDYVFAKYSKKFLDTNIRYITYNFFEEQLTAAYVYYKTADNDKISEKLVELYGLPVSGRYSETTKTYTYYWQGTQTYILLTYSPNAKDSYVYFTSKTIQDRMNARSTATQ